MSTNPDKNADPLLSHEYDGIREYDNPMPAWWKTIFWLSFYFAIGYMFHYQWSDNGPTMHQEYEAELTLAREAEAKQLMGNAVTEESLATFMANPGLMTDAKKVFVQRCAQCHGAEGEGLIGPNLTDNHWLHGGGTLMGIHTVIDEGVAAKGMPPWGRQLRPVEVRKLAAFVGTLRGTFVKGPRAPEGTEVTAGNTAAPAAASGSTAPSAAPPSASAEAPSTSTDPQGASNAPH